MTYSVDDALARFKPAFPLGVAFSGGADSTALLAACAYRWPGQVQALHVNHGLQAAAPIFEAHCKRLCESLSIPLRTIRVNAKNVPGQSPEDAARQARYQALATLAQAGEWGPALAQVALAQHADDQVETLLLAWSRGAGLPGLSGMGAQFERCGMGFVRPFLQVSAVQIRGWLKAQTLGFVEDPSNADPAFTRNRIRAHVLPPLAHALPQFRDTFARSATHIAQAQILLDEVAQQDLLAVLAPAPGSPTSNSLDPLRHAYANILALQRLSRARQANVLRYWFKTTHATTASTAQLDELLDQVACCKTRGHHIHIKLGAGFVVRKGEGLAWYNA